MRPPKSESPILPGLALVLCAMALAACSDPAPPATGEAPVEHVLEDQVKALDKARGVQDTLDQALKERTQQLEDDGG